MLMIAGLLAARVGFAAEPLSLAPPLITLVPQDIGNNEIWYIGGAAATPRADVLIFLQGEGGDTQNFITRADENGAWFYTHPTFLREGAYRSWAQMKVGDQLSPPGPQVAFHIVSTALRIGSLRISFETLYLGTAVFFLLLVLGIAWFALYHFRHFRHKRARLTKEIREAVEEARRGFILLRQDIQEELGFIARIKKSRELNEEERRREEKLMQDLNLVEQHVMEELGDVETAMA
jgi:cbb3-type cytochrome oxidase subunit 3